MWFILVDCEEVQKRQSAIPRCPAYCSYRALPVLFTPTMLLIMALGFIPATK